jgi:hypothetical protein
MQAYKKYLTVDNPNEIVLSGLPVSKGQKLEIVIIADNLPEKELPNIRELLDETQANPVAKTITEEDIKSEIDAYRRGQ